MGVRVTFGGAGAAQPPGARQCHAAVSLLRVEVRLKPTWVRVPRYRQPPTLLQGRADRQREEVGEAERGVACCRRGVCSTSCGGNAPRSSKTGSTPKGEDRADLLMPFAWSSLAWCAPPVQRLEHLACVGIGEVAAGLSHEAQDRPGSDWGFGGLIAARSPSNWAALAGYGLAADVPGVAALGWPGAVVLVASVLGAGLETFEEAGGAVTVPFLQ